MSRLMSAIGRSRWSGVRSYSKASSNSSCQCESVLNAWPAHGLARGVELQQLLGHVAHGLLDLGLRALPRRAAEPVDRRRFAPVYFLHEISRSTGTEQLVAALARGARGLPAAVADADLLEPDECADAVVDVDDGVADFRSRRSERKALVAERRCSGAPRLLQEDICLRIDLTARRQADVKPTATGRATATTQHAAYRASSARSTGIAKTSYSLSSSIERSGPAWRGGNERVSPRSAARVMGAL